MSGFDTKRNRTLVFATTILDVVTYGATTITVLNFSPDSLVISLALYGIVSCLLLSRKKLGNRTTFLAVLAVVFLSIRFAFFPVWSPILAWIFFASEVKRFVLTVIATVVLWGATTAAFVYSTGLPETGLYGFMLLVAIPVAYSERLRMAYAKEVAARQKRRESDLQAEVERTASNERTRIARELHDVVAHSVTVMVVQARGARQVSGSPPNVQSALEVIEESGRQSLTDLRQILGVLRSETASDGSEEPNGSVQPFEGAQIIEDAPYEIGQQSKTEAPQPSFDDLGDLIDRCEKSGVETTFSQSGKISSVSKGMQLVIYRIIQESLTNVVRHAKASEVAVRLTVSADTAAVEIVDDGVGPIGKGAEVGNSEVGHGLLGMKERVDVYGGQFSSGAGQNKGFYVRASFPLNDRVQGE